MRRIIITGILVVMVAFAGMTVVLVSGGVSGCVSDPQACMNKELAWPDFLDNAVKRVLV